MAAHVLPLAFAEYVLLEVAGHKGGVMFHLTKITLQKEEYMYCQD